MMKKIIFCALALVMAAGAAHGQKKTVAVVPTLGKAVNDEIKNAIQGALEEGIHRSGGYKLLARGAGFQQALKEFEFQQKSGAVGDEQLKDFGHAVGADFVCYAQINKISEVSYRISYKLVNVESGEIPVVSSKSVRTGVEGLMDAMDAIAEEMFGDSGGAQYGGGAQFGSSSSGKKNGAAYNPDGIALVYVEGAGGALGMHGFYIGKYEVTQAQYQKVMGSNPSDFKSPNNPVNNVSWNDAQEFLSKLNAMTGRSYRLPTEDEWVYAANGGLKNDAYEYAGSNNINDVAWFTDNSGDSTHPVGTKLPNAIGIHDMTGNVWEWCQDWYDSSNTSRVYRGGSWYYSAGNCRVASRHYISPDSRDSSLGFRLALP